MKIRQLHLSLIYRYPTHFPTYRKTPDFGPFCITLSPLHSRSYTTATTLSVIHYRHYTLGYYTLGYYTTATTFSGTTLLHLHYCRSLGIHLSLIYRYPTHFPTYMKTRDFGPFCITIPPLHTGYTLQYLHTGTYTTVPTHRHTYTVLDLGYTLPSPYTLGHTLLYIHYCGFSGIHLSLIYRYPTHFPTYRKTRDFGPFCITIPQLHYRSYTTVTTLPVLYYSNYTAAHTYMVPTYGDIHTGYTLQYLHYCGISGKRFSCCWTRSNIPSSTI